MTREIGRFPFGQPNTERPARRSITERPRAMFIGVYPSAWHVQWKAPAYTRGGDRKGSIAAMAVDVEPTVFWDGAADDFASRLARWIEAVGFRTGDEPGTHGHIERKPPSKNGASGQKIVDRYLAPLRLSADEVVFTDIYPIYMMKPGSSAKRGQLGAVRTEYDSIAKVMGVPEATVPARIRDSQLPAVAAKEFGRRVLGEIAEAAPPLVVTLGIEPWQTLRLLPDAELAHPASSFAGLYSRYGARGTIKIGGRTAEWLPLVHPGLLSSPVSATAPLDLTKRTLTGWRILHARWETDPTRAPSEAR